MEASRAATGMLEVLATREVRFMMDSFLPFTSSSSSGKSLSTCNKITWSEKAKTNYLNVIGTVDFEHYNDWFKQNFSIIYLSHLIATLSTTNINNDIRVGILGKSLWDTGLATTESTRNSSGSSLYTREQSIQDSLTSKKRMICMELLTHWTWLSYWPHLRKDDMELSN